MTNVDVNVEEWKDLEFNSNYQISNFGRVFSKSKNIYLSQNRTNGNGYKIINMITNGKRTNYYIHRLVAIHFLDKIDGKNIVDHIGHDKSNNHVSNLRWCNHRENSSNLRDKFFMTSQYVGVSRYGNKYVANIFINKKSVYLGTFESEFMAGLAYQTKLNEINNK